VKAHTTYVVPNHLEPGGNAKAAALLTLLSQGEHRAVGNLLTARRADPDFAWLLRHYCESKTSFGHPLGPWNRPGQSVRVDATCRAPLPRPGFDTSREWMTLVARL